MLDPEEGQGSYAWRASDFIIGTSSSIYTVFNHQISWRHSTAWFYYDIWPSLYQTKGGFVYHYQEMDIYYYNTLSYTNRGIVFLKRIVYRHIQTSMHVLPPLWGYYALHSFIPLYNYCQNDLWGTMLRSLGLYVGGIMVQCMTHLNRPVLTLKI